MARTFYPRKTKTILASKPHEAGTEYKISVGDEDWGDGTFQSVVKVQMVYDGKVAGRMSPSYPVSSKDWKAIQAVIDELVDSDNKEGKGIYYVPVFLSKDSVLSQFKEIISLTEEVSSSEKLKYIGVGTGFIDRKMTGIFNYTFYQLVDELKLLCDYKESEGLEACDEMLDIIDTLDSDDYDFVPELSNVVDKIKKLVQER